MLLIVCRLIVYTRITLQTMTITKKFGPTLKEVRLSKNFFQEELLYRAELHRLTSVLLNWLKEMFR